MTGLNAENDRPPRPLSLEDLARELLRGTRSSIFSDIALAQYEVQGETADLLIELGLKFPDLFPEPGQPLPWEYGDKPMRFQGFPYAHFIEANYTQNGFDPSVPSRYEVKLLLYYGDEFAEDDRPNQTWHMELGMRSRMPGVYSSMTQHHFNDEARYNPVELKIADRSGAQDDLSLIVAKYVGDYIDQPPIVPEGLEGVDDFLDDFFDSDD